MSDRRPSASVKVQVGSVVLTVSPHTRGWRFAVKGDAGKWEYHTRAEKKDAVELAREKAREIHNRTAGAVLNHEEALLWQRVKQLRITHADLDAWATMRRMAVESPLVKDVIQAMIKAKENARGERGIGLATLENDLKTLPQDVPIASLHSDDIDAWLDTARARGVSQRRLKNLRGSCITLFKWAQGKKHLPAAEKTAPELTEAIHENRGRGKRKPVVIYNREELQQVIKTARSLLDERASLAFLVVIGAYAGVRTEEIAPLARTKSEGLRWENFDRERKILRVPEHVSKTGFARIVPIHPILEHWLKELKAPKTGPVMTCSFNTGLKHFRIAKPGLWKKNALRHSYGTYRTAQTQDMPRVSLEMGNSVAMVRKHYFEAVSQEDGEAWFAAK
jgi:hypothetical protein